MESPNSCYVCHGAERLERVRLKWKMFDGTPVDIVIHKCWKCISEAEELMKWKQPERKLPEEVKKLLPILAGVLPLWFYLKGGML